MCIADNTIIKLQHVKQLMNPPNEICLHNIDYQVRENIVLCYAAGRPKILCARKLKRENQLIQAD